MSKTPETSRIRWVVSSKPVGQVAWFLSRLDAEAFLHLVQDDEEVFSIDSATHTPLD